ncbi:MAG: ABC transporter permease [Candidatus Dormibacteraeota bacterium]|nr:ABC transporter permease [Candidatus Dormibacteraeota bacterium]
MTTWERLTAAVDNPLIVKDGVSRMRTWKAPLIVTLYVGLMGALGYAIFVLAVILDANQHLGSGAAQVGATVFEALAFIQISLISLFAPALAAGAISGERERQTLDVLLVSRVSALGIVWGKLVASVAFMLLLILAALPLFAAVFLFGGIDGAQFLVTQLLTVTTAVSLGSMSVFLSALFRRTLPSTVASYGAAFGAIIGTFVLGWLFSFVIWQREGGGGNGDVHPLLFVNPLYSLFITLTSANGAPLSLGRLVALFFLVVGRGDTGPQLEPWQGTVLVQLVAIGLFVFGAVRLVQGHRVAQPRFRPEPEVEVPEPADEEVPEP